MENQIKWHYWPMSDEEYRIALAEIEPFDMDREAERLPVKLPQPVLNGVLQ